MTTDRKKTGWIFRTTLVLISLPVLYVGSFGPACWATSQPWENGARNDGWDVPPRWMLIYAPFGAILNQADSAPKSAVEWWATIGMKPGGAAVVPYARGRFDHAAAIKWPF